MKTGELFDVRGLAVAVTGGASGIGRAFGEALADNGGRVTLLDIDRDGLAATTDELQGVALFLSSPASSYVTGTQILVDGGNALGMTVGS